MADVPLDHRVGNQIRQQELQFVQVKLLVPVLLQWQIDILKVDLVWLAFVLNVGVAFHCVCDAPHKVSQRSHP